MLQEGLRCIEVAQLDLHSVDLADRTVFIDNGKGGHQRLLPLSDETYAAILRYLGEVGGRTRSGPLVRSALNERQGISAQTVSQLVTGYIRDAGLKRDVRDGISAHACRHTMATDMLLGGAHLRDVQAALGHASIATTERYLPTVVHGLRDAIGGRSYLTGPGQGQVVAIDNNFPAPLQHDGVATNLQRGLPLPLVLDIDGAAELLGVSRGSVYRMANAGRLPAQRRGTGGASCAPTSKPSATTSPPPKPANSSASPTAWSATSCSAATSPDASSATATAWHWPTSRPSQPPDGAGDGLRASLPPPRCHPPP
jgi:excisionase family DNA binding protein